MHHQTQFKFLHRKTCHTKYHHQVRLQPSHRKLTTTTTQEKNKTPPPTNNHITITPSTQGNKTCHPPTQDTSQSKSHQTKRFLRVLPTNQKRNQLLYPRSTCMQIKRYHKQTSPHQDKQPRPRTTQQPKATLRQKKPTRSIIHLPIRALRSLARTIPGHFQSVQEENHPHIKRPRFLFTNRSTSTNFNRLLPTGLDLPASTYCDPPASFDPDGCYRLSPLSRVQ